MIDVRLSTSNPVLINKWKVRTGMPVVPRQIIMLYEESDGNSGTGRTVLKYKSNNVGTIRKICATEGSIVNPGQLILQLEECRHPAVMKDMCAECGADLRQSESIVINASVPMVHSIPELKVSEELAQTLGKADEERLLKDRKLVLLVDLDQTLIHTTNDNIPPNLKDVVHFQLYGPQSQWYHTRIRPGTEKFLESVSNFYELHICTFGARNYAHHIAMFLDPDGRLFSHRILSRDECFDANSKTANLRALFPCGDSMVCIIDDREDVWNYAPNLIHVKPYHFFQHTGDINAPPGLTKKENDTVEKGFDFSKLGQQAVVEGSEVEKKTGNTSGNKKKTERSGETTTDKDTEDEKDFKPNKLSGPRKSDANVAVAMIENSTSEKAVNILTPDNEENKEPSIAEPPNSLEPTQSSNKEINDGNISAVIDTSLDDSFKHVSNLEPDSVSTESEFKETTMEDKIESNKELRIEITKSEAVIMAKNSLTSTSNDEKVNCEETADQTKSNESPAKELIPNALTTIKEEKIDINTELGGEKNKNEEMIEVEDSDDYLLHLEDILKKVHATYYEFYDKLQNKTDPLPDLKVVIPEVKRKVLEGCNLVFSGLVPSHVPLHRSRAYAVAKSLGANVTTEVTPDTTHLVAARAGTVKVNSSRRQKGILIVTPHWLWHCAERWEKVDERLYPLARGVVTNRHPPAHCGSPQHPGELEEPPSRPRTDSGRFSDTINPLLTFTLEEMASMDQEVEDLCADDDDSESEAEVAIRSPVLPLVDPDSSSCDSLTGGSPKGWEGGSLKSRKRKIETTTCTESDLEEDWPSAKFRRGEPLPSDLDLGDDTQDSQDADGDDSAWALMGAALEREFLSGD